MWFYGYREREREIERDRGRWREREGDTEILPGADGDLENGVINPGSGFSEKS